MRISYDNEDLKNLNMETCARPSCGMEDHIAERCPDRVCANCKVEGHLTKERSEALMCTLCGHSGHLAFIYTEVTIAFPRTKCHGKDNSGKTCLPTMLESAIQRLAGADRHSRLDAYGCRNCYEIGRIEYACPEPESNKMVHLQTLRRTRT